MSPELKPLNPSDYRHLKRFVKGQTNKLSAYSLPSIIAWSNDVYQPFYAIEDNSLIFCTESSKHPENRHLILPFSPGREFSPGDLHNMAGLLGFTEYWFIPEDYIGRHGRPAVESYFEVIEQREYEDYIFLTSDISQLSGRRYAKKRNLIHQFTRTYIETGRVEIENISPSNVVDCLYFLEKWCDSYPCESDQEENLACEKKAAINMLNNIAVLEVDGILIRVDGQVSAFGIRTHLTDNMAVLIFEKAFSHIKGLYQFLDNECGRQLFTEYEYLNKESDMGIDGLARSKQSYYPAMRVKSCRLKIRE
ncbi:MAG: phosphatidylglycerol lysyltransferase domain-containing protein [Syntrophales bacterium]|nr:phosphatidylglycerol lysyltransferase domain-containing protein [Syntrophales bacterium]